MGPSILQQHSGSVDGRRGTWSTVQRAWSSAGRAGAVGSLLAVAACVAVTVWWLPSTARVIGCGVAVLVLAVAALVDTVEHRLPNGIVATALAPVAVTLVAAWSGEVATSVLLGAAFVAVPLLVTHLVSPAGMGFGDVKAGAVLGAALGLVEAQLAVFALVLALLTGALWGLARRARSIPLGPALVAGALVSLALGRLVGVEAE